MEKLRQLLVVIDPTATNQPALARARQLARASGAGVELFVCFQPHAREQLHVDERVLERLANELREQGIDTRTDVASASSLHAGIVSKVLRARPSLVLKDTHAHSLLRRSVLANTDWQLVRLCPAPVLFVRPGDWRRPPRIGAAVDVSQPGEKPAALDYALLEAGESFALITGGLLYAAHAYVPVSQLAAGATVLAVPMAGGVDAGRVIADEEARVRSEFEDLVSEHGVPAERRRLLKGVPADMLPAFVRECDIDVLVMGAYARGWMYNVFVGSTTERLLDELPCDVLVIKPARFECPLSLPASSPAGPFAPASGV